MKRLVQAFLLLLFPCTATFATHIRAGEITVRRIFNGPHTYEITVIAYTDTGSPVQFGEGNINLGDGSVFVLKNLAPKETIPLGNDVAFNRFVFTHTYDAAGGYTISYQEGNRNAGVLNMVGSVNTPFYIETSLVIDPAYKLNSSPVLLVPPVDRAVVGARFVHNPGAFDQDGDSLAYKMWYPKQNRFDSVFNYQNPNHKIFYEGRDYFAANQDQDSIPSFTLNPISGDLVWDAPGMAGEYNVAFIVEEWRLFFGEWKLLGKVTRDMQIIVEESDNKPPDLILPEDICVEAGTFIQDQVTGIDPEGMRVLMEAFGGPFEFSSGNASFSPAPPVYQQSPGTLNFTWQTACSHVRKRPYEIRFKVTDEPADGGAKLVDFDTWNITVVAPAPTGLAASSEPNGVVRLSWDEYTCSNAELLQIWRRVESYDFTPANCEVGMPAYAGYELIDVVDAGARGYADNNLGAGLNPGASYCYRLVASFHEPEGGLSYVSAEACAIIRADAPVITHVDVDATSAENGRVNVSWTSPFDIDKVDFPPPYTYEVLRAKGLSGDNEIVSLGTTQDTTWVDQRLNTADFPYNYLVRHVADNGQLIGASSAASTVRLELKSDSTSIDVNWRFDVPWSNNSKEFPKHFIYRNNVDVVDPDGFYLISSIDVPGQNFHFADTLGLVPKTEYCYYVTTQGSYGNPAIAAPLLNRSQIICGYLDDKVPPCPPVSLALDDAFSCEAQTQFTDCVASDFSNRILWEKEAVFECEDEAVSYNVYFSALGEEGTYNLIAQVNTTGFTHENLKSFKGCYRVAAVDNSGNESEWTDPVCNDNCPYFELPNVFTPNNDGKNDLFIPYYNDGAIAGFDVTRCMRFVKSVDFKVYDRSGKMVYYTNSSGVEGSIFINWAGQTEAGIDLPSGVYYYVADVEFDVLDQQQGREELKGWVQLVR
ncbi:gliding motility-associated C-terminal domain-containing protein [uncultured Imperialibacter sp.]|uniref:T9SS type B sorting domain-containing protein n=1 Tax=uncultured Imperialibacter sp. TaxID=1672639 RepID=UPI0030D9815A|tara:strand:+ start:26819 stop:29614 length:2796 start_codon:yes stop_codon:yes gene_type:complete